MPRITGLLARSIRARALKQAMHNCTWLQLCFHIRRDASHYRTEPGPPLKTRREEEELLLFFFFFSKQKTGLQDLLTPRLHARVIQKPDERTQRRARGKATHYDAETGGRGGGVRPHVTLVLHRGQPAHPSRTLSASDSRSLALACRSVTSRWRVVKPSTKWRSDGCRSSSGRTCLPRAC